MRIRWRMENTWNTPSFCFRISTFEKLHKKVKCPYVFSLGCSKNRLFYPTWPLCFRSMAHLVCFIISRCAGSALNPSRQIHAFHSARIQYKNLLKTNRISARGIKKHLIKKWHLNYIHWRFYFKWQSLWLQTKTVHHALLKQRTNIL